MAERANEDLCHPFSWKRHRPEVWSCKPDASARDIKQNMYSRGWELGFSHLRKDRKYCLNIEQGSKLELRSLNQARTLGELPLCESGKFSRKVTKKCIFAPSSYFESEFTLC